MKKLQEVLEELQTKISQQEVVNTSISEASVGWHIEHSLLVINSIIKALKNSDPKEYEWKFNFARLFVYTMNKIPRGKGKAPERVRPREGFDAVSLQTHLLKTVETLEELNHIAPNSYFVHPYFGKLNLKGAIKFLRLHTNHHIHIINDILKKKGN